MQLHYKIRLPCASTFWQRPTKKGSNTTLRVVIILAISLHCIFRVSLIISAIIYLLWRSGDVGNWTLVPKISEHGLQFYTPTKRNIAQLGSEPESSPPGYPVRKVQKDPGGRYGWWTNGIAAVTAVIISGAFFSEVSPYALMTATHALIQCRILEVHALWFRSWELITQFNIKHWTENKMASKSNATKRSLQIVDALVLYNRQQDTWAPPLLLIDARKSRHVLCRIILWSIRTM